MGILQRLGFVPQFFVLTATACSHWTRRRSRVRSPQLGASHTIQVLALDHRFHFIELSRTPAIAVDPMNRAWYPRFFQDNGGCTRVSTFDAIQF